MACFALSALALWVHISLGQSTSEHHCRFTHTSGHCEGVNGKFLTGDRLIDTLYIENSDLSSLTTHDFSRIPLINTLRIINSSFPENVTSLFAELVHLQRLYLEKVGIREQLLPMIWAELQLTDLSITNTNLTRISKTFFSLLKKVRDIDLSANKISVIEYGALDPLTSLKELYLHNNSIGVKFSPCSFCTYSDSDLCVRCLGELNSSIFRGKEECQTCYDNSSVEYLFELWKFKNVSVSLKHNPVCTKVQFAMQNTSRFKSDCANIVNTRLDFLMDACGLPGEATTDGTLDHGGASQEARGSSSPVGASPEPCRECKMATGPPAPAAPATLEAPAAPVAPAYGVVSIPRPPAGSPDAVTEDGVVREAANATLGFDAATAACGVLVGVALSAVCWAAVRAHRARRRPRSDIYEDVAVRPPDAISPLPLSPLPPPLPPRNGIEVPSEAPRCPL